MYIIVYFKAGQTRCGFDTVWFWLFVDLIIIILIIIIIIVIISIVSGSLARSRREVTRINKTGKTLGNRKIIIIWNIKMAVDLRYLCMYVCCDLYCTRMVTVHWFTAVYIVVFKTVNTVLCHQWNVFVKGNVSAVYSHCTDDRQSTLWFVRKCTRLIFTIHSSDVD